MKQYDVVLAAPPWKQFRGRLNRYKSSNNLSADVLSFDDPLELFVKLIALLPAKDHSVFIWTTDKYAKGCDWYMKGRGYTRYPGFIWISLDNRSRISYEYLHWYYKGDFIPLADAGLSGLSMVITEPGKFPGCKPDGAYASIEALYPLQQKAELFGLEQRAGWDQFGIQEHNQFL